MASYSRCTMTQETSTMGTGSTMTMNPSMSTAEPMTSDHTVTGSTQHPVTQSSVHTTMTSMKTTVAPQPTPKPSHGFDGGSFAGGIALGIGLAAILVIAYRCYIIRHKAKGYTTSDVK